MEESLEKCELLTRRPDEGKVALRRNNIALVSLRKKQMFRLQKKANHSAAWFRGCCSIESLTFAVRAAL